MKNNRQMAVSIISVILMVLIMGCNSTKKAYQPTGQLETVSPAVFKQGLENNNVQLLDVRSAEEFEDGHIKGALNIDVQEPEFEAEAANRLEKEKPVYVYCRSGRRSLLAGEMLAKDGYNVVDLDGGILGWERNGMPIVKD